jgi:hypothetical protein
MYNRNVNEGKAEAFPLTIPVNQAIPVRLRFRIA